MANHPKYSTLSHLDEALNRLLPTMEGQTFAEATWENWKLKAIRGGANNRIYRATNDEYDLAIKWTIRDQRHRARREYSALCALAERGLALAPQPVLVDEQYLQPVVVYAWLDGDVTSEPPRTDHEWMLLIEHLATIHTITPTTLSLHLERAVLNARSTSDCRTLIQQQLDQLPTTARPEALPPLVRQLEHSLQQTWSAPPLALCRVDPNTSNFVRCPGTWASVDWENSGWGDPAFEIADLMSHPAYVNVEPTRWSWVIEQYCALTQGQGTIHRINVYYRTMLVWWVIRFARMLYEVPRGGDKRLAERPAHWREDVEGKLLQAVERANSVLSATD